MPLVFWSVWILSIWFADGSLSIRNGARHRLHHMDFRFGEILSNCQLMKVYCVYVCVCLLIFDWSFPFAFYLSINLSSFPVECKLFHFFAAKAQSKPMKLCNHNLAHFLPYRGCHCLSTFRKLINLLLLYGLRCANQIHQPNSFSRTLCLSLSIRDRITFGLRSCWSDVDERLWQVKVVRLFAFVLVTTLCDFVFRFQRIFFFFFFFFFFFDSLLLLIYEWKDG